MGLSQFSLPAQKSQQCIAEMDLDDCHAFTDNFSPVFVDLVERFTDAGRAGLHGASCLKYQQSFITGEHHENLVNQNHGHGLGPGFPGRFLRGTGNGRQQL